MDNESKESGALSVSGVCWSQTHCSVFGARCSFIGFTSTTADQQVLSTFMFVSFLDGLHDAGASCHAVMMTPHA